MNLALTVAVVLLVVGSAVWVAVVISKRRATNGSDDEVRMPRPSAGRRVRQREWD